MHHPLVQTPNPAETDEDSLLPHLNLIDAQLSVYFDPYYSTNCSATCSFPCRYNGARWMYTNVYALYVLKFMPIIHA